MKRQLETCPVCKVKKLVGRHEQSCQTKYPVEWIRHLRTIADVQAGRMGRQEMLGRRL